MSDLANALFIKPHPDDPVEWVLQRDYDMPPRNGRAGFALGKLYFDRGGDHVCETLEDEDRKGAPGRHAAIPLGRYQVTLFRRDGIELAALFNAVPQYKYIKMRGGPINECLHGDIIVGMQRTLDGVSACEQALHRVVHELRRHWINNRKVFCTVERTST